MEEATASLFEAAEALGPVINAALTNEDSNLALVFTDKWNLTLHSGLNWMGDGIVFRWYNKGEEVEEVQYHYDFADRSVLHFADGFPKRFENGRVFFVVSGDVVAAMIHMIRNKTIVQQLIVPLNRLPVNLSYIYFTVAVHQIWAFAEAISDGDHAIKSRVFRFLY